MKVYIRSAASISPQSTFGKNSELEKITEYFGNKLTSIEPDYSNHIDTKSIRRMSRIIRIGVATAMECLAGSNLNNPGAIITGTAFGCMEDTSVFLKNIIENQEDILSPTAFIQSTHNTVAAQIALLLNNHSYNNTFVHRGFSFESALIDAIMLLKENDAETVLVGGFDEITEISHTIISRFGIYRNQKCSNADLFSNKVKGTIAGEGAAFFLLANDALENDYACLNGVEMHYQPTSHMEIESLMNNFLSENSITPQDLSLVIVGRNGDYKGDEIYSYLEHSILKGIRTCNYKHLCGEYPTSTGFALWLAAQTIKTSQVPFHDFKIQGDQPMKNVLIYNHDLTDHHSMILLSSC